MKCKYSFSELVKSTISLPNDAITADSVSTVFKNRLDKPLANKEDAGFYYKRRY